MKYAEVYVNIKTPEVKQPFDYEIPDGISDDLRIGSIVSVPFNNRKQLGYIARIKSKSGISSKQIKQINEVLFTFPFDFMSRIKLIHWMSNYFIQPFSKIIGFFAPPVENKKTLENLKKNSSNIISDYSVDYDKFPCINDLNPKSVKIKESILYGKFKGFLVVNIFKKQKMELINYLCAEALRSGKDIMVLSPEISGSEFLYHNLDTHLKDTACIYHSEKKKSEKTKLWKEILAEKYKIIIGTRTTVFLPVKKIGLIILDEEHDQSYKDGSIVRFSTQDVVLKFCRLLKIPAVFISNTPTIKNNYLFGNSAQHSIINWNSNWQNNNGIKKIVLDLKKVDPSKEDFIITSELHKNIYETLKQNSRVLLYSNQKGYSSFLICKKCGFIPKCEKCNTSYKYHNGSNMLVCHHCSGKEVFSGICIKCGGKDFSYRGAGVEKIEELLKKRFSGIPVFRIDSEILKKTVDASVYLEEIKMTNPAILISTQAIFSSMNYNQGPEDIKLVVILDFDKFFSLPDFSVNEKVYQLLDKLKSVIANSKDSKLIIQAWNSQNPVLKNFISGNYDSFYLKELENRKELSYPPFSTIINIILSGKDEKKIIWQSEHMSSIIQDIKDEEFTILGPAPSPFNRINFNYRWHIIIKTFNIVHFNLKLIRKLTNFKKDDEVKIIFDVNPLWIL
jgi:primosomal protein N' (replication factor Y) (superfamily II helicase)